MSIDASIAKAATAIGQAMPSTKNNKAKMRQVTVLSVDHTAKQATVSFTGSATAVPAKYAYSYEPQPGESAWSIQNGSDILLVTALSTKAVSTSGSTIPVTTGTTHNIPSRPTTSSVLAGYKVAWDGLDSTGNAISQDTVAIQIHSAATSGFTPNAGTLVDTVNTNLAFSREYVVQNYSTLIYVRFIAVSSRGNLSAPSATSAPGIIPSQAVSADVIDGIITTLKLADDAVATAKIQANAVTVTQIADNSISTPKLIAGSVAAGKIAAGAVQAGTIAADAVTAGTIAALAVTAGSVSANAITGTEIAAGSITATHIASSGISADSLTAGQIIGITIMTAAFGSRIALLDGGSSPDVLRWYNAFGGVGSELRGAMGVGGDGFYVNGDAQIGQPASTFYQVGSRDTSNANSKVRAGSTIVPATGGTVFFANSMTNVPAFVVATPGAASGVTGGYIACVAVTAVYTYGFDYVCWGPGSSSMPGGGTFALNWYAEYVH